MGRKIKVYTSLNCCVRIRLTVRVILLESLLELFFIQLEIFKFYILILSLSFEFFVILYLLFDNFLELRSLIFCSNEIVNLFVGRGKVGNEFLESEGEAILPLFAKEILHDKFGAFS